jgi:hypothetical protein
MGAPAVPQRVEPVHDFARKLRQPGLFPQVKAYLAWARESRAAKRRGDVAPEPPALAPLSINLDLTTACNYACDHCIDWDMLNTGVSHDEASLRRSVETMAARGLKSVILIGGGEPTVHPGFVGFVRFLKALGLQTAIVSNGSRNERILEAVDVLDENDWVRLSLDAGTDATFQRMHRPKKPITLEAICAGVRPLKERNPKPRVGFSFLIAWDGAEREAGAKIVENVDEIPLAARLARDSGFDYVSFKPFLTRADGGAEVMTLEGSAAGVAPVVARIRARVDEAKALATETFRVVESTNLRVLEAGTWRDYTAQPRTCHMQALRQVLSPLGVYNCPAHRGAEKAKVAPKDAWAGADRAPAAAASTAAILERFDASVECRAVTCLYHGANWWLERAVEDERETGVDAPESLDWFL